MKKRTNMRRWNNLRNLVFAGVVVAFFVSAAPVVSYGADRLLVKDDLDNTKFVVTDAGFVGAGTGTPARQLHLSGPNAVVHIERSANGPAFMLVRTAADGTVMKTFSFAAAEDLSNNVEFVINDLGTAIGGPGTRRMTIANDGSVFFPDAVVTARDFVETSSIAYKTNVKTYGNALETVKKLRGVSFNWKDSGKPSVGLIAEEVDEVIPEVVAHDGKTATGVNYSSLVGVLVEAVKEQQKRIQKQDEIIQAQQTAIQKLQEQQKINAALSVKVSELERLLILSNTVSKAD